MAFEIEVYNKDFWKSQSPDKDKWVKIYDDMRVHTRGEIPGKLLLDRRPNEDENIFEFRLRIYQPITKGAINRSINRLFRIFANANYSVKASDDLKEYLQEKSFDRRTFNEFLHGNVVRRMIEDPNGYLAWLPSGEGLVDATEKVDVYPLLIESCKIQHADENVLTWYEELISDTPYAEVYWSLTETGYYKHIRIDDGDIDSRNPILEYELIELYHHDLGMLPAVLLGGVLREANVYDSYFEPFLPFGNEAIRVYSDWQAVMITSAFPYRTEQFTECDFPGCEGKGWYHPSGCDSDDCVKSCPICEGTGFKPHTSPYGVFRRPETGPGEAASTAPMVEFTSPATDILDFITDAWLDKLLTQARKALHDDQVEEAQSGVAKIIDREDFYAFLTTISDNIFDNIMFKSLTIIGNYRDITGKEEIAIIKPTSFTVKTEQDLVNELATLIEKKAPLPFVIETIKDLTKKRFSDNPQVTKMIEFMLVYDPYFAVIPEVENMLIAANIVDNEDIRKSYEAYRVLNELMMENPEILNQPYKKIKEAVDKRMAESVPERIPIIPEE